MYAVNLELLSFRKCSSIQTVQSYIPCSRKYILVIIKFGEIPVLVDLLINNGDTDEAAYIFHTDEMNGNFMFTLEFANMMAFEVLFEFVHCT